MNQPEVLALLRFIAAACPAQKLDEYTADAWAEVLADIAAADAKLAVIEIVRRQPFISCSDIATGVKNIRTNRLRIFGDIGPAPAEILDDTRAWQQWERKRREAIMSGRITRDTEPPKELTTLPQRGPWWEN